MASTATTSLLLEKQGNTENRGTWGEKVNVALDILDKAVAGTTAISTTGGTTTLTNVNYTADQAKAAVLSVTGTLVSNAIIVVPNVSKIYTVVNGTTGSYTLTIKTSSGSGKTITQGKAVKVYVDGSDGVSYLTPEVGTTSATTLGTMATQNASAVAITGGTVTGITDLAVADGGTGASTAAGARDNLGISEGVNQTNFVHVADYGAVGDADDGGTTGTDDTAAFQAAIDAVNAAGGGLVRFTKRHLIDSTLNIKANVMLCGPHEMCAQNMPIATDSYDDRLGVLYVNSAATLSCTMKSGIRGCYIVRKGLIAPYLTVGNLETAVAAFAGTAITIINHDVTCERLFIIGFAKAIHSDHAANPSRGRIEYVHFDCTDGIHIDGCYDIGYITHCHAKPYLSSYVNETFGATSTTANYRSGTAFKFTTQNDWGKLTNCFCYGWAIGFDIDAADSVTLIGCGADHINDLVGNTSIGFRIYTGAFEARLIGCQAAAQGTGFHIESGLSAAQGGCATLMGCNGWGNDSTHVYVVSGRAIISNCVFRGAGTTGVLADATAGALTVTGCEFDTLTTPLNIHATPLALSQVYGNRAYNCTNAIADEALRLRANTAASSALEVINTADATPARVGRFRGIRPTPANNDTIYTDWELSDAAGNTTVCFRQNVRITDTTNTSEDAQAFWSLMVGGTITDKLIFTNAGLSPVLDDGMALGTTSLGWSDLHLATGGVINWANGEVTLTGAADAITFAGGTFNFTSATSTTTPFRVANTADAAQVKVATWEGDRATPAANDEIYQSFVLSDSAGNQDEFARITCRGTSVTSGSETGLFRFSTMNGSGVLTDYVSLTAGVLRPSSNDVAALGSATVGWSDLFLASGAVINFNASDVTLTHSANMLTMDGGVFNLGGAPDSWGVRGLTAYVSSASGSAAVVETSYNHVFVNADTMDATAGGGSKANAFKVRHEFGDSNTKGGRHAIYGFITQEAATSATNTDRNYVGIVGHAYISTGDGGGAGTEKGAYFGGNFVGDLISGATNTTNVTAAEFNTKVATGASTLYRSGIQIAGGGDVRGSNHDCAIGIGNLGVATTTWRTGIKFGTMHGDEAFGADSTVIEVASPATIDKLIDASGITFTTSILETNTVTWTESALNIGTSAVVTCGTIELGAASDTTLARGAAGRLTVEGVDVVTISSTDTLTNKTFTSSAAATPAATFENTTNNATVEAIRFTNAKTGAGSDKLYAAWYMSDNAGAEVEVGRMSSVISSAVAGSVSSQLRWSVRNSGTLAEELLLTTTALSPIADDGLALGTTTAGWSDLHLATGGVINWANGEILLTGAANTLALTGGSFGVGTTPDAVLHAEVDDATNNGITYVQRLTHTTSGTAAAGIGAGIEFELENNVGTLDVAATIAAIYSDAADGTEDGTIVFRAMSAGGAHAETMRITGTNVLTVGNSSATFTGILATTPRIQMHGTNGTPGSLSSIWANNNTAWPTHTLAKSRGASVSTYTIVQSGDTLGEIGFMGADGSALANAASIRGEVDGTPGAGDMPGRLVFMTSPDASTTLAEAMRISADKSVTIKGVTTVCNATATPAGGSTSARLLFGTTAGFGIYYGSGAPTVSAAQGSLYLRSDGSSTSTRMYVNTDGGTTWTNFTTAA